MSAYDPLLSFLRQRTVSSLVLSFVELEVLLKRTLPTSARTYPSFWARGNHVGGLLGGAGWRATLQARHQRVLFRRIAGAVGSPETTSSRTAESSPADGALPDIVLIGCVKSKRDGRHRAEQLYTSALFAGRADYARNTGNPWLVLSSKYGLVRPDEIIETYDVTLKDLPAAERRRWSYRVLEQIDRKIGSLKGKTVEIHAGKAYRDRALLAGLRERGAAVTAPLAELRQGEQLAWYAGRRGPSHAEAKPTRGRARAAKAHREPSRVMPARDVQRVAESLTREFQSREFDLSRRSGAPPCGWNGIPEIDFAARLRAGGVSDAEIRRILTFGIAMDRARDADRLWEYVSRLFGTARWAFDPAVLRSVDAAVLRKALAESGVSQRHGKDSHAWRRIGEALTSSAAPRVVRDVIDSGRAEYRALHDALQAVGPDGLPWFPLLRGPKISLVWIRMLAVPGRARISGLEEMPVAVDAQVRKATEYLGVTQTQDLSLVVARPIIQAAWRAGAVAACGPDRLAGTAAALDPAVWFLGKWGCTRCEAFGAKSPISSVCSGCRMGLAD